MTYTIQTTRTFEKDFTKLDVITQSRILIAIEKMQKTPFSHAKKLKNVGAGLWRIRIGDYGIRFDVIEKNVVLYRVRHRKEVYR